MWGSLSLGVAVVSAGALSDHLQYSAGYSKYTPVFYVFLVAQLLFLAVIPFFYEHQLLNGNSDQKDEELRPLISNDITQECVEQTADSSENSFSNQADVHV